MSERTPQEVDGELDEEILLGIGRCIMEGRESAAAVFDPDEGFIVSANNRPIVKNPPLGYFFSANDRVDRLSALLRQKDRIDWKYLQTIQQDVLVQSDLAVRDLQV